MLCSIGDIYTFLVKSWSGSEEEFLGLNIHHLNQLDDSDGKKGVREEECEGV